MLLDALLAAEEDVAVAQVSVLTATAGAHRVTWDVVVAGCVCLDAPEFRICPFGLVANEPKGIDLDLFAFNERGRRLDCQLEQGGLLQGLLKLLPVIRPLLVLPHQ